VEAVKGVLGLFHLQNPLHLLSAFYLLIVVNCR
jgi:hypothetical protein